MNQHLEKFAVPILRWVLGLVIILESYRFAVSSFAKHFVSSIGLPSWVAPALGGLELVAAVLFLIPPTALLGSYALLFTFFAAALIHFLHGALDVSGLVVYAAAVLVCMTHCRASAEEATRVG